MALTKQPVQLNFAQGLDTKSDPNQLNIGNFLALQNITFDKPKRASKRNGFTNITALPDANQTTITTLNDNLVATGSQLYAFSEDTNQWLDQGLVQPVALTVLPLLRVSTSQTSPDIAVATDALVLLTYVDSGNAYYQISDSVTGQQIVKRTALPSGAVFPRTFNIGDYFLVTYITTSNELAAQVIEISKAAISTPITLNIGTVSGSTAGYAGVVLNNSLYLAWAASGSTIDVSYISNQGLSVAPVTTITGHTAALMSLSADVSNSYVFVSWAEARQSSTTAYVQAYSTITGLSAQGPVSTLATAVTLSSMTSSASQGVLTVFLDNYNVYPYTPSTPNYPSTVETDYISVVTYTYPGYVVSGPNIILRSVGLASKSFVQYVYRTLLDPYTIVTSNTLPASGTYTLVSATVYTLVTYGEPSEPTYFLIDSLGNIIMRLAYSNGGGYYPTQVLPNVAWLNDAWYVPYLYKDFLTTVNKGNNVNSTGTPIVSTAIYTQTGVNLAKFEINLSGQYSSEIAGALHLTGGQLWEYDAVKPVEHNFHVWPETIFASPSPTGGFITTGTYYYQFTYEWTDNQGNLHRSAPSIPVSVTTSGSASSVAIDVPTLRLTYKQPLLAPTNTLVTNPVRIVGYRWSVAQQIYYQFTSVTSPVLNDPTVDYVTIVDIALDSTIAGQAIIYTTGGVVEDIAAPASIHSALFKNRLFIIDAEDQNLLWFSKQVIEATPVEMSDLFTLYIAPTTGTQGSTGPCTALSAMDDKLIIFKKNAAYYLTGTGPDNTGANNDFSDPIFITSSVGCDNPASIVLMQNGIMFQSKEKGIWLLGRDLSTNYIGAPVEAYNGNVVQSAQSIPGTNQVRFILDNGVTLMYDYFVGQWGTHTNVLAESSTLYQGLHTYLNSVGQIYQETPGLYLDGSAPVLMSLTTAWIDLVGLQGYERFYYMYLLGTYYSPFYLNVQIAYDYNQGSVQNVTVTPDNYILPFGEDQLYGQSAPWGGQDGTLFQAKVHAKQQKCQAFQLTITESPNNSYGYVAGEGLNLSALTLVVGAKRGYNPVRSARSFG